MNNNLSELATILTNGNTQTDTYISLLTNADSEKPLQFSCYIDWKEEAEEIIRQLKRVESCAFVDCTKLSSVAFAH